MSSGEKVARATVMPIAERVMDWLADGCDECRLAGSLRREERWVGDVEIVLRSSQLPTIWARLDKLIANKTIRMALYGDKRTTRWGDKYRGFVYQGIKFEVFSGDAHNYGYQLWLRTGPANANQHVMSVLSAKDAPYRPRDSYWWHGDKRIAVPDEQAMFCMLGMPFIPPQSRSTLAYKYALRKRKEPEYTLLPTAPQPTQKGLFE